MIPITAILALVPLQEAWTSLPLPGLSIEPAATSCPEPLTSGEHLLIARGPAPGSSAEAGRRTSPAALPQSVLLGLLQEEVRRSGSGLQIFPGSGPLIARGPAEALDALRARLAALDEAGERLEVELEAWLVPGGVGASTTGADGGSLPPGADDAAAQGLAWGARMRSGEGLCFGQRESRPFVADYHVEVASDSGVAAPIIGRMVLGKTLHLVASRALGGTQVHVEGFLDLAEFHGLESFDPDTPDLGILEQPIVSSVQLAFSGAVRSGELLRVDLSGVPLETPDWTLWIRARTRPDASAGAEPGWDLLDLALLARAPRALPGLSPGAALDSPQVVAGLPRLLEPLAPSALGSGLSPDPRRSAYPTYTDRIALVERGAGGEARSLRELCEALERVRLATRIVELEHGPLRASFPVSHGSHARLRVGLERVWLTDYDAQIAPDTWMPVPVVERAFDGLAWQGVLAESRIECSYWTAATNTSRTRSAVEARLGAVQLPERTLRAGTGSFGPREQPHGLLAQGPGSDALGLRLR